ncbi:Uncharacterised protein [Vibrio cholerae]|nr:Uncharacterised protein [Vibrio cholerae]
MISVGIVYPNHAQLQLSENKCTDFNIHKRKATSLSC